VSLGAFASFKDDTAFFSELVAWIFLTKSNKRRKKIKGGK